MDEMKRYAVYYAPRPGPFADRAASWLGWDAARFATVPHPSWPDITLAGLTAEPRRYGFHGTLRAPFRAAPGVSGDQIASIVAALAARQAPVRCDGLALEDLHDFFALTPVGSTSGLNALAAAVVEGTESLRAPLSPEEIARRRPERLSQRQRALLDRWGYPFVMEEFRFHLTLTDRLDPTAKGAVARAIQSHFAPVLPVPFEVEDLCLFGEAPTGRFHLLGRFPLSAPGARTG